MKNKKKVLGSLIREALNESFGNQEEDKLISKQDAKKHIHPNVSKDKGSDDKEEKPKVKSDELIRLAVGGFIQAFDAIGRAVNELDASEYKQFAQNVLMTLKKGQESGDGKKKALDDECLAQLAHQLSKMYSQKL